MTATDHIRNSIIDKLLTITNKDYLASLYQLVDKSGEEEEIIHLSDAQLLMLNMSDEDIKNNRIISHEEADKRGLQWLKSL